MVDQINDDDVDSDDDGGGDNNDGAVTDDGNKDRQWYLLMTVRVQETLNHGKHNQCHHRRNISQLMVLDNDIDR